jgi:hypothetical protein
VRVIKREVSVPGRILYVDATQVDGVRVLEVRVERSAQPQIASVAQLERPLDAITAVASEGQRGHVRVRPIQDRTGRVTVAGTIGGD